MNLGKTILELRRQKNVTQEELAAELGVTAAAVSKWENSYTLPDILMLCALADFFEVTTDELLGRVKERKHAVIAAKTEELGKKIAHLAAKYNIHTASICTSYQEALEKAASDESVSYILLSMEEPVAEARFRSAPDRIQIIESQSADEARLMKGLEVYLEHMLETI